MEAMEKAPNTMQEIDRVRGLKNTWQEDGHAAVRDHGEWQNSSNAQNYLK